MTDRISPQQRSWNMSRIRSRDTLPERRLRSALHRAGFRFRLHDHRLPGKPDLVLTKYRAVIMVHGCFWHRHPGCPAAADPKTNTTFWQTKFAANIRRDKKTQAALESLGWTAIIVWECQLKRDLDNVVAGVSRQLGVIRGS